MSIGEDKKIIATKLFDLANLAAAALVFGEVAARELVRWPILAVGGVAFALLYIVAGIMLRRSGIRSKVL